MVLYKYLSAERIDVLSNLRIRFTQVGDLNDPYEGLPRVSPSFVLDYLPVLADEVRHPDLRASNEQRLLKAYYELPEEVQRRTSAAKYIMGMCERISQVLDRRLQEMAALPDEELGPFGYEIAKKFQGQSCGKFGVLSLSEVIDSPSMWDRYAEKHTGFAIGLDSDSTFFNPEDWTSNTPCFRKITYVAELPCLTQRHDPENDIALFFSKLDEWKVECEWRLLRRLETANSVLRIGTFPVHLFELPAESVTCVVLGSRVSQESRDKILAILSDQRFAHVRTSRSQICPEGMALLDL